MNRNTNQVSTLHTARSLASYFSLSSTDSPFSLLTPQSSESFRKQPCGKLKKGIYFFQQSESRINTLFHRCYYYLIVLYISETSENISFLISRELKDMVYGQPAATPP